MRQEKLFWPQALDYEKLELSFKYIIRCELSRGCTNWFRGLLCKATNVTEMLILHCLKGLKITALVELVVQRSHLSKALLTFLIYYLISVVVILASCRTTIPTMHHLNARSSSCDIKKKTYGQWCGNVFLFAGGFEGRRKLGMNSLLFSYESLAHAVSGTAVSFHLFNNPHACLECTILIYSTNSSSFLPFSFFFFPLL